MWALKNQTIDNITEYLTMNNVTAYLAMTHLIEANFTFWESRNKPKKPKSQYMYNTIKLGHLHALEFHISQPFHFFSCKKIATKQNMEVPENNYQVEIRVPLIRGPEAKVADEDDYAVEYRTGKNKDHKWILYLTTFVTVCGSFAFGSCVCLLFT